MLVKDELRFMGIKNHMPFNHTFPVNENSIVDINIDKGIVMEYTATKAQRIDIPDDLFEYRNDTAKYISNANAIAHYDITDGRLHFTNELLHFRVQYSVEPNQEIADQLLRKHRMGYVANDEALAMLMVYTDLDISKASQTVKDKALDIELNIKEDIKYTETELYL